MCTTNKIPKQDFVLISFPYRFQQLPALLKRSHLFHAYHTFLLTSTQSCVVKHIYTDTPHKKALHTTWNHSVIGVLP